MAVKTKKSTKAVKVSPLRAPTRSRRVRSVAAAEQPGPTAVSVLERATDRSPHLINLKNPSAFAPPPAPEQTPAPAPEPSQNGNGNGDDANGSRIARYMDLTALVPSISTAPRAPLNEE